jgi:6 kDa early secretory antigenic target
LSTAAAFADEIVAALRSVRHRQSRGLGAAALSRVEPESNRKDGYAMPGLKVTPDQLSAMGGSVARVSTDIRGAQQSLKGQLAPLFGADWSGAAAAQFTALYEQFDQHAKGLSDALDGIGQLLGRAGASYAEVEQQIAASFR